ncbi:MAG: acetamidase/formamidase family protein [Chloroflexi bacterium]|nr:acetamidase/formamidase family protein [Chloroflexota bacterium]
MHIDRDRTYNGHSRELPPIATIDSGDVLELDLVDSSGGQLHQGSTVADVPGLDISRANPTLGPILVHDARPGDVVQVDILEARPQTWAYTVQFPGNGILPDLYPDPWIHIWHIEDGEGWFRDDIRVPLAPFPGVVCTAAAVDPPYPATHVPIRVGGNLDLKQLVAGSSIYLPVEVEGALLSIGDPHWAQGDGEVCGSAIEGAIDCTIRVTLRRDLSIDGPELDVRGPIERPSAAAAGYHVTTGIGPDLRRAARDSVARMIEHLVAHRGVDRQEAYALCSVAVDLRISEVVDAPNWVVSAFLPHDLFRA